MGDIQANTETANAELMKRRAMCQKILDRERVIAGCSSADSGESPNRSETSSAILAYVESAELLAEELVAPKLRPPPLPETGQSSSNDTGKVVMPVPNPLHAPKKHLPMPPECGATLHPANYAMAEGSPM